MAPPSQTLRTAAAMLVVLFLAAACDDGPTPPETPIATQVASAGTATPLVALAVPARTLSETPTPEALSADRMVLQVFARPSGIGDVTVVPATEGLKYERGATVEVKAIPEDCDDEYRATSARV